MPWQSQDILLTYFDLVNSGVNQNQAVEETVGILRVGTKKVYKVFINCT